MHNHTSDVVIIGGGLTGLTLAYFLKDSPLTVRVVEARERIGGRILTKYDRSNAPQEMGATWLGQKHNQLTSLLEVLDINVFEQILGDHAIYEPISTSPPQVVKLPPNTDPSYRIAGGTSNLINKLSGSLGEDHIDLGQVVQRIQESGDMLVVTTQDQVYSAAIVVSTLPPYLFNYNIALEPKLPSTITDVLESTHTWMGESIKIGLTYARPFWRSEGSSGTIMSNVGPIPEMYDHANYEDDAYALIGFLNGSYHGVTREQRLDMIMKQLAKYYGDVAKDYLTYEEVVWSKEPYTHAPYSNYMYPHQNNGHQIYRQAHMNGKLFIAGTETAATYPGYMEGAIRSAAFINDSIRSIAS